MGRPTKLTPQHRGEVAPGLPWTIEEIERAESADLTRQELEGAAGPIPEGPSLGPEPGATLQAGDDLWLPTVGGSVLAVHYTSESSAVRAAESHIHENWHKTAGPEYAKPQSVCELCAERGWA